MRKIVKTSLNTLFSVNFWRVVGEYTGVGKRADAAHLDAPVSLEKFLNSRASHVAQTSLYGYMKTRAGTRFPELFEDPGILLSINIAKWQVWLACWSDLAVYCGALLCIHIRNSSDNTPPPTKAIRTMLAQMMTRAVAQAVEEGARDEAGDDFAAEVEKVRARIADCDFNALGDDDSAFTESPRALLYWAPIADELKQRDAEIVRNSVRFRWHEIRRDLRRRLRAEAVVAGIVHGL